MNQELLSSRGTCKGCQHSRLTEQLGGKGLYCHCNPPQFVMMPMPRGQGQPGQMQMHGLWPPVADIDNCGQFAVDPMVRQ